jgi:ribokinase
MNKVIVFGSLNMDLSIESDHMPSLGETIMGRCFITNPGGKGANQAVAASRLGAEVYMLGAVGEDAFGDQMIAALAEQGVHCERIMRTGDLSTGVALITRVQGDNFITIASGANKAPTIEHVIDTFDDIAEPGDVFLTQLECNFEATLQALKEAHERGMYTVFNPAPARLLPDWVMPHIDLIIMNEGECELLTGIAPVNEESSREAMNKLTSYGVASVAVTLGSRGSLVWHEGEMYSAVPDPVKAVDTTCAGDTYIGALVAGHARKLEMRRALAIASKASSLAITKVGAQQSIPLLADVEAEIEFSAWGLA